MCFPSMREASEGNDIPCQDGSPRIFAQYFFCVFLMSCFSPAPTNVPCRAGSNKLAFGSDEGTLLVKVARRSIPKTHDSPSITISSCGFVRLTRGCADKGLAYNRKKG